MTRFIAIADTHIGACPMGYQQQPAYPERSAAIITALADFIEAAGQIDFILHAGDMIDVTSEANISAAADAFGLDLPVYLCLGNHDLTTRNAAALWIQHAPGFFLDDSPDYTIETTDCVVHVVPNHWQSAPYYWQDEQLPHLSERQLERLSTALDRRTHLPHLLMTHSPVFGLPEEQTGFEKPHHAPPHRFTEQVAALAAEHANLACVISAHNHMNMRVRHHTTEFVSVSSLVETPFEFKLFEVTPEGISMVTKSLAPRLEFEAAYDKAKSYVQGRSCDRHLQCCLVASCTSEPDHYSQ